MLKTELWKAILGEMQINITSGNFRMWLGNSFIDEIKDIDNQRQIIKIATSNPFVRQTVENRYYGQIKEIVDRITKKKSELVFIVKQIDKPAAQRSKKQKSITKNGPLFASQERLKKEHQEEINHALAKVRLRQDFNFQTFAVSSSNEMAYAAAQAVAERPGEAYHLLFFYGGVGVGKTHLMQAIGQRVIEKKPQTLLVYCTGEEFTNEIIEAIRKKSTQNFRKKYRSAKVLLIDDIQFIAGKNTVQEEFFHTFNAIQREGGQIIMTSDRLPEEIQGLEDRLRSRFEGGLMVDIQEPNFELRTAILLIKSKAIGINLPMDVAQLIAANVSSTRRLEGFLMRLASESKAKEKAITPDMAQALLGSVNHQSQKKRSLTPKETVEAVADYYQIKTSQIKGKRRQKHLVDARHLAMYLIRTEIETPLTKIGQLFGNRDHTSVLHGVEKITKNLSHSEDLRLDVNEIKKALYGQP